MNQSIRYVLKINNYKKIKEYTMKEELNNDLYKFNRKLLQLIKRILHWKLNGQSLNSIKSANLYLKPFNNKNNRLRQLLEQRIN